MAGGGSRVYTVAMRREPSAYTRERELYRKAGKVWISYGVPFIVPITAGFFSALIFGDILFYLLSLVMGG
jgi:preflagellin peptidase FlaK